MMNVVDELKELIDLNGTGYLKREPYSVYKKLIDSKNIDKKVAGAILLVIADNDYMDNDYKDDIDVVSVIFQDKYCFNKRMSYILAGIFSNLYTDKNEDKWKKMINCGWKQFKKSEFAMHWDGVATWVTSGGGCCMNCYYEADLILKPTKDIKLNEDLMKALEINPFLSIEEITEYYKRIIEKQFDDEFDYYCTCDKYYQPCVEDFSIEDYLGYWLLEAGFEIICCEGSGYDGGYEAY